MKIEYRDYNNNTVLEESGSAARNSDADKANLPVHNLNRVVAKYENTYYHRCFGNSQDKLRKDSKVRHRGKHGSLASATASNSYSDLSQDQRVFTDNHSVSNFSRDMSSGSAL